MIETKHGLESNPVPTSIFAPQRAMMEIKLKMDVGTMRCLKRLISRRSEFGGFLHARDIRAIPT